MTKPNIAFPAGHFRRRSRSSPFRSYNMLHGGSVCALIRACHLLVLTALLCCTGCSIFKPKNGGELPSETALSDLGKAPLEPGTLKMSVGAFFKHLEEKRFSSRGVMLRMIVPPSAAENLADVMKRPCAEMALSPSSLATEGALFDELLMSLSGQHPQYDSLTVFVRCFDPTHYPSYRIGHSEKEK